MFVEIVVGRSPASEPAGYELVLRHEFGAAGTEADDSGHAATAFYRYDWLNHEEARRLETEGGHRAGRQADAEGNVERRDCCEAGHPGREQRREPAEDPPTGKAARSSGSPRDRQTWTLRDLSRHRWESAMKNFSMIFSANFQGAA